MVSLRSLPGLLGYNLKISFGLNMTAALCVILLTPFVFSLTLLEQQEFVKITELYLPLTGIILLTFLVSPEEKDNIHETVYTKTVPYTLVFILRAVLILLVIFLLICCVEAFALFKGSSFSFGKVAAGSWVTAVLCGMTGLTVANIFKDAAPGYLIAFAYFGFEFFSGGKYTGDFYLFSLLRGSFDEKWRLLGVIAVLFLLNIIIVHRRS